MLFIKSPQVNLCFLVVVIYIVVTKLHNSNTSPGTSELKHARWDVYLTHSFSKSRLVTHLLTYFSRFTHSITYSMHSSFSYSFSYSITHSLIHSLTPQEDTEVYSSPVPTARDSVRHRVHHQGALHLDGAWGHRDPHLHWCLPLVNTGQWLCLDDLEKYRFYIGTFIDYKAIIPVWTYFFKYMYRWNILWILRTHSRKRELNYKHIKYTNQ